MELCTSRHLLLSVFILQLTIVSIRQVFDFLGFMWASVLANFIFTILIIFGIYGVAHTKPKYTIAYTVSSFYWIFWNLFIVFIYFNLIGFYKHKNILSFQTEGNSWWETNGPGCKVFLPNSTLEDPYLPITSEYITGCVIDFHYVEGVQAAIHTLLAIWGFVFGLRVSLAFMSQNDNLDENKKSNNLPLYSIDYNSHRPKGLYDDDEDDDDSSLSPEESDSRGTILNGSRPMTPRRVKRRNVNSKSTGSTGTLPLYPQRQDPQPPPYIRRPLSYASTRSSGRSSTRKQRTSVHNPVSKFLEQQQQHQKSFHQQMLNDSSTSNDSYRMPSTSSRSQLLSAAELMNHTVNEIGHVNPSFVSNVSLDRPPSARSSYSNYHGVRTLAFNKQATPQVPSNSIRRNTRPTYSTFLNDGPPAYEIQGAVNSETVI